MPGLRLPRGGGTRAEAWSVPTTCCPGRVPAGQAVLAHHGEEALAVTDRAWPHRRCDSVHLCSRSSKGESDSPLAVRVPRREVGRLAEPRSLLPVEGWRPSQRGGLLLHDICYFYLQNPDMSIVHNLENSKRFFRGDSVIPRDPTAEAMAVLPACFPSLPLQRFTFSVIFFY